MIRIRILRVKWLFDFKRLKTLDLRLLKIKFLKMYKYTMRLGFGSDQPLIEFETSSDNSDFINDLKELFHKIDFKVLKKEDLWMNDEILYWCSSNFGEFQISSDNYRNIFILSEVENCISNISELLQTDSKFQKNKEELNP